MKETNLFLVLSASIAGAVVFNALLFVSLFLLGFGDGSNGIIVSVIVLTPPALIILLFLLIALKRKLLGGLLLLITGAMTIVLEFLFVGKFRNSIMAIPIIISGILFLLYYFGNPESPDNNEEGDHIPWKSPGEK